MSSNEVSRRSFVKGAAMASSLAAGMAATQAVAQPIAADDIAWDKEADVVVIGFGGAGAVSAISAHDAGAEVLILEKMATAGGNTRVSGGGVLTPTNAEDAYTYFKVLFDACRSEMDEEMVRMYCQKSTENVEWLCALKPGAEMETYGGASYKSVVCADSQLKYGVVSENGADNTPSGHTGADLFDLYTYAIDERGIEVMLSTPAERLLTNAAGEVIGCVAATEDGSKINVKARKAVILTTGGFEYDREMQRNYLLGAPFYAQGNTGNAGDGVRMAMAVGADLWHMNAVSCTVGFHCDDYEQAFIFNPKTQPQMIWVNQRGKRFANELGVEGHAAILHTNHFDTSALAYHEIPSFRIYDDAARVSQGQLVPFPFWSQDNLVEVEKGWVVQADTVAELAEKIGVDPAELTATIDKWNEDTAAGTDTLFGRPVNDGAASAPIATPPFYAVTQLPTIVNTQGGPRRNVNAQIVDALGSPIPRLYSAGELGSMWGVIYQGAGNNSESVVFGRVAGENAAALENWDA